MTQRVITIVFFITIELDILTIVSWKIWMRNRSRSGIRLFLSGGLCFLDCFWVRGFQTIGNDTRMLGVLGEMVETRGRLKWFASILNINRFSNIGWIFTVIGGMYFPVVSEIKRLVWDFRIFSSQVLSTTLDAMCRVSVAWRRVYIFRDKDKK